MSINHEWLVDWSDADDVADALEAGFSDWAPGGVYPPDGGCSARRSPQVRAAERDGTRRPDLIDKPNALEV